MQDLNLYGVLVPQWLGLTLVYVLWVGTWLLIKKIFFRFLKIFAHKTSNRIDDALIHAAGFPLTLLILTSGGVVIERMLPIADDNPLHHPFFLAFKVVMIVAIILFVDRFAIRLINLYSSRYEILRTSASLSRGIAHTLFFGLGSLVILDSCGISVTPVLASLGIGSLAVALALQPTLENLFSGIQIVADKPIQLGQFIKLESGEEGYVTKIGWRSTWVCLPTNNVVVIPNKLLVNSRITNYYYPDTNLVIVVQLGVHYGSDLEHVERVALEVAREVIRTVEGGVKTSDAVVRFSSFGDFSIKMNIVMRVQEISAGGIIQHEFIKRLHKRFKQEGIVIPYSLQAVNLYQEKAYEEEYKDSKKL